MSIGRDMSKAQFLKELKKREMKVEGFMGYVSVPLERGNRASISVFNADSDRRRTQLAYLIAQQKRLNEEEQ